MKAMPTKYRHSGRRNCTYRHESYAQRPDGLIAYIFRTFTRRPSFSIYNNWSVDVHYAGSNFHLEIVGPALTVGEKMKRNLYFGPAKFKSM